MMRCLAQQCGIGQPAFAGQPAAPKAQARQLISAGGGSVGSAVYLLASLFNHSCEPNVDVHFSRNDGVATFVAARDIDEGEPLCIS